MSFVGIIKYILFYIVTPAIIFILVFHLLRDYGFYKLEAVIIRAVFPTSVLKLTIAPTAETKFLTQQCKERRADFGLGFRHAVSHGKESMKVTTAFSGNRIFAGDRVKLKQGC